MAVNFTAVVYNLVPAQQVVDRTISGGLVGMVDESMRQVTDVNATINGKTQGSTSSIKQEAGSVETSLRSVIDDLNDTLGSIDIDYYKEKVWWRKLYNCMHAKVLVI